MTGCLERSNRGRPYGGGPAAPHEILLEEGAPSPIPGGLSSGLTDLARLLARQAARDFLVAGPQDDGMPGGDPVPGRSRKDRSDERGRAQS
jgi:hypothetical protein